LRTALWCCVECGLNSWNWYQNPVKNCFRKFELNSYELTAIASGEPGTIANADVSADDIFTLCWTSGTEAEPKSCPMSHNNWEYLISLVFTTCGLQPGDRILCVAPLVNMTAVGVNYVPWLAAAGTLVLHHPITPDILILQLTEERIQYTILVPAMLNMIVKLPDVDQLDLSSIPYHHHRFVAALGLLDAGIQAPLEHRHCQHLGPERRHQHGGGACGRAGTGAAG